MKIWITAKIVVVFYNAVKIYRTRSVGKDGCWYKFDHGVLKKITFSRLNKCL